MSKEVTAAWQNAFRYLTVVSVVEHLDIHEQIWFSLGIRMDSAEVNSFMVVRVTLQQTYQTTQLSAHYICGHSVTSIMN